MQNRRDWLKSTISIVAGMSLSEQLMAAPVSEIERKQWGKFRASGIKIKLNSNENPYGPSDKAKQALKQIIVEGNRYAFDVQEEMKTILAEKEGVSSRARRWRSRVIARPKTGVI
jgi:histidinol-phosphate aminotransferase